MDVTISPAISSTARKSSTIANFPIRTKFLTTYYQHQPWSLPDTVIYYIAKNPSTSKCYQKIIKSCKYFFVQNSILICPRFYFSSGNNEQYTSLNGIKLEFNDLSNKIWITKNLEISNYKKTALFPPSFIISKIYQSDVKEFRLMGYSISMNDFCFIATKCEQIFFSRVTVMDENDSVVALEKIIEVLFNLKEFEYYFGDNTAISSNIVTPATVKELVKIPHFLKLKYLHLQIFTENFDIDTFYDYIKKNKTTKISIEFCNQLSQAYKRHLQAIVNEIIIAKKHKYKIPIIQFPGIDRSSISTLVDLYNSPSISADATIREVGIGRRIFYWLVGYE